eukprot:CAMPEP_0117445702 /NCGR_PEP_ID=MMETSP0759-20121206/5939_1 /TAXON_ID=63605 /ORGANISM="Percolomonas cosmopolitus, Strain WS" /LENGTH=521 /DNA_ID=CAMNT_0005237901 /DNA_START=82 /DNA_END=1647 /DNA_ORIENTATION=-
MPFKPNTTEQHSLSEGFQQPQVNEQFQNEIERISLEETDNLVKSFKDHFDECIKACKKPNILVAGITGAGKSALVNAVFGSDVAESREGMPVTQHFQKFEPPTKPVVIYDSKGLEWSEHEEFIKETGKFFTILRNKPDVADHIHVVWYVINPGRGRVDPFELNLVREVLNPTPVIFILNKADLADSHQLTAIKDVIEKENLPNNKGVHICVANRQVCTQSWCPSCMAEDLFYDEETKELACESCGYECVIEDTLGMEELIKHTSELLPELAKDAFMYSQQASIQEKDRRAKDNVKSCMKGVSLDYSGNFIQKVAKMCAQLFVIWGWPLTADKFQDSLAEMQKHYVKQLKMKERMAVAMVDKLLGSRLSKAFVGIIGITMNRGMKQLNENLVKQADKGALENFSVEDFMHESDMSEDLIKLFFEAAIREGIDKALDKFWDISPEELQTLAEYMKSQPDSMFNSFQFDEEGMRTMEEKMQQLEDAGEDDEEKLQQIAENIEKMSLEEPKETETKDEENNDDLD